MELFDELVECDVSIVVPHLKDVLEFCLEVGHCRRYQLWVFSNVHMTARLLYRRLSQTQHESKLCRLSAGWHDWKRRYHTPSHCSRLTCLMIYCTFDLTCCSFTKTVQKKKLLPKLLTVVFSIMASSPDAEEGEEETGEDAESGLPSSFASQVRYFRTYRPTMSVMDLDAMDRCWTR